MTAEKQIESVEREEEEGAGCKQTPPGPGAYTTKASSIYPTSSVISVFSYPATSVLM